MVFCQSGAGGDVDRSEECTLRRTKSKQPKAPSSDGDVTEK